MEHDVMIADTLSNWDKAQLASILAEMTDAEDLIEAFPSIDMPGSMEEEMLPDFIEQNWEMILRDYDVQELQAWVEEKEDDEQWEAQDNEHEVEVHEYCEYMTDEYYWDLIDFAFRLRCKDLAEERGFFSRFWRS